MILAGVFLFSLKYVLVFLRFNAVASIMASFEITHISLQDLDPAASPSSACQLSPSRKKDSNGSRCPLAF